MFWPQAGNIYIVDFELLDGISANRTDPCTLQYLAAPICLLYKNAQNKIMPIAIQVQLCCVTSWGRHFHFQIIFQNKYVSPVFPPSPLPSPVFFSSGRLRVKTTRSSCPLMVSTTGCWQRSGSAQLTSSTTRTSHTCSGHIWSQRCLLLPCTDSSLLFIPCIR